MTTILKLTLDNLQVKDLFDTGTKFDPQDPALIINIGKTTYTTERSLINNDKHIYIYLIYLYIINHICY